MATISTRQLRWLLASSPFVLAVFLLVGVCWQEPDTGTFGLHIANRSQLTNGTLLIGLVLSNGTARTMNVVDDVGGNPIFVLDAGEGVYPPGSSFHSVRLGFMGNSGKINLAPGKTLQHTVGITNPPSRFRLQADVRDLAAERQNPLLKMFKTWTVEKLRLHVKPDGPSSPTTPWIEPSS